MSDDRKENQPPTGTTAGKAGREPGAEIPSAPLAHDTKMATKTATPDENDPVWRQLGSTRVVEGEGDSSLTGVNLGSAANYTEMSPSRVLGKNLTKVGDYQLLNKLGEGAMGAVYKAVQVSSAGEKLDKPRTVALKILFPHVANNQKLVERLYREGRVMGQLDHPNIITATAIGEAEGCHYVAMEYVSGQSMQKWMTQLGRIPVADAVRITLDCAKALTYAHKLNMVHRDIKPDNILLTKTGIVKVADLGMVKIDDEEMSLTQTGHAVGTPWFMPLEQAKNAKDIDGRSDIYALGCTLYAFLTGRPPFMGRTIVEVIQAKGQGTFPPARQANPDVPERLDLILVKMTAREPKNRYQTCEELTKDLESLGLASERLTFVAQKKAAPAEGPAEPMNLAKTTVMESAIKTSAEKAYGDVAAPALVNPNAWYIQLKMPDGSSVTRRYTTAQLLKMLDDGTISATAKASHNETDGFRGLATYREFQGAAMSKIAKKAVDKNTARTRGISKRIEDDERERAQKDRRNEPETALGANVRFWLGTIYKFMPVGLLIWLFVAVLHITSIDGGWTNSWWEPVMPAAVLLVYTIHWFFSSGR